MNINAKKFFTELKCPEPLGKVSIRYLIPDIYRITLKIPVKRTPPYQVIKPKFQPNRLKCPDTDHSNSESISNADSTVQSPLEALVNSVYFRNTPADIQKQWFRHAVISE